MADLTIVKWERIFFVVPYDDENLCWDFDNPVGVFNSQKEAKEFIEDREK